MPGLACLLTGDVERIPSDRVKYGGLVAALRRQFPDTCVHSVGLRRLERWLFAARTFHPRRSTWQARFYMHPDAFLARSRNAARYLRARPAAVALQIGALFAVDRSVIYTDYTAALSRTRPGLGRSPYGPDVFRRRFEMERQAYQRAYHVFTRSEHVRQSMQRDYGLPPERVTAVGGGVNLERLPDLAPPAGRSAPTVLFIGKDFHRKGGDILLAAFARARQAVPDARLRMMTAGPLPPGFDLESVEVLPPTWDRAVIDSLYRQADVFALPSRLETWGDVLLEAMAYAVPCVGVSGEAMPEIITHGVDGLIVPPDDPQALGDALASLLADAGRRRALGGAARARVERDFTWAQVVARMAPTLRAAGA